MSNRKYRPYLTLPELECITLALRTASVNMNNPPIKLIRYIENYIFDVKNGGRLPAATVNPSLEQKLGMDTPLDAPQQRNMGELLEEYENIGMQTMTISEAARVQNFRYTEGLMDATEEREYEAANLKQM